MPRRCLVESIERRLLMASIQVLNTNDSGPGSLRAALAAAAGDDTIDLTGLTGTIALQSELTSDKSFTLAGPGADKLTISGSNHTTRAFNLTGGWTTIRDVRIADAGTPGERGGALLVTDTWLTLTRCVLANNLATTLGGAVAADGIGVLAIDGTRLTGNRVVGTAGNPSAAGGAVSIEHGTLTAGNSTFDHNTAEASATGVAADRSVSALGGAVFARGSQAQFGNVTLAYNVARTIGTGDAGRVSAGGAIALTQMTGGTNITHATVARNTATTGGGIATIDSNGTLGVRRSVVADNYGTAAARDLSVPGVTLVDEYDIIGAGDGMRFSPTTVAGLASHPFWARLGNFGDFGGLTPTIELGRYSLAINLVAAADSPPTDQRGTTRYGRADAGAYELATNAPSFTSEPILTATDGVEYRYTLTGTDPDGDRTSFESRQQMPDWLTLTNNADGTATLHGTPSRAGTYAMRISVRDGGGIAPEQSFTIVVAKAPPPPSPVALVAGELTVIGTEGKDDIQVWTRLRGTQVRVARNGMIRNFRRADVAAITVDALGGDDRIALNADVIGTAAYGGAGDDTLIGGAGRDSLGGGTGDDLIYGGGNVDLLRGHGGRDRLFGEAGDDRVYGGAGNDRLDGGGGIDRLWGEDGRDTYYVVDGRRDVVDATVNWVTSGDVAYADTIDYLFGVAERHDA